MIRHIHLSVIFENIVCAQMSLVNSSPSAVLDSGLRITYFSILKLDIQCIGQ